MSESARKLAWELAFALFAFVVVVAIAIVTILLMWA
jgi:hypothetical protein